MIIPLGVCLYAVTGGLKATFTTSYIHTVIIFGVCCLFMFKTFSGGGILGSIDLMYDHLVQMGNAVPIPGNKSGSYLTAFSLQGFYTDINGIIAGFVQIFVDQSYWQSAVAASPMQAVKGYMVGTVLYFAIVYSLPISMGLAAVALDLPLSGDEASNGLVLPAVAIVYFGKAGAVLVVIICFMAVTSSGAGEILAAASLFTFDVYRKYIRPKATGKELLAVSRSAVVVWGIIIGLACCMCTGASISYNFMGVVLSVFVGGAVLPVSFVLFWGGCTALGACVGTLLGGICGVIAWVVTAQKMYVTVSVLSLQNNEPVLAGCCVGVGLAAIVCTAISLIKPNKESFDWSLFDHDIILSDKGERLGMTQEGVDSAAYIARMRKYVWMASGVFFILVQVLWPLLSLPAGGVWSRPYFKLWVVIGFILIVGASLLATILPVWEARALCFVIIKRMLHWDSPKRGLNYDGNEYSHNGNVVVGDANIDTTAGKGFGTTTSPAHAAAMNDSAHGGDKASAALKLAA
ncbi:TPA: urea active transporter, variant 2 [Trebouxia sp. C0005]